MSRASRVKWFFIAAALVVAACQPKGMYTLTTEHKDNDRTALSAALAKRQLPEQLAPMNSARQPRVFVLEQGAPKTIVAYDLAAGSVLWKADADVQSRIWTGGDILIALEAKNLVARDQKTGSIKWKVGIKGQFVGASADKDRAYVVTREGTDQKPTWYLSAYDASSGKLSWTADPAAGQLGAPVAHAGLVYSPFLTQWLIIVDGKTGAPLARLRGVDEQISVVRATSRIAYFGSKQGVFALDARAATGKRSEATYGQAKIPAQLDRTSYGVDLYDSVQAMFTAADRARVLWSSEPTNDGPMKFTNDTYAVHYFRYMFGFNLAGDMVWAYQNPRVEIIASEHTGNAIVGVSANGDIVALDPKTGAIRANLKLGTTAQVVGATFDADGWAPAGQSEKPETVAALVAIARDRDARFDKVKELAVATLSKLEGPDVTKEMLAVLSDKRAPAKLKETVVEMLAQRRDPAALPVLTAQLAVHSDYIAKTEPESLTPVVKAIAGMRGAKVNPDHVGPALTALRSHLEDPATQIPDIVTIIDAMSAIGGGAERATLSSHLLLYHADDDLGTDASWQAAIVAAVHAGGPMQRELLRQVGLDPRTKQGLVDVIKETLAKE
jgi:outer membrane protein assembly factor BamB